MLRGRRRTILIAAAALVAVGAAGYGAWMLAVRQAWIRYNKYDRREEGTIRVGDYAPNLALAGYDGAAVRLASLWKDKPLVLVFGSCT